MKKTIIVDSQGFEKKFTVNTHEEVIKAMAEYMYLNVGYDFELVDFLSDDIEMGKPKYSYDTIGEFMEQNINVITADFDKQTLDIDGFGFDTIEDIQAFLIAYKSFSETKK